MVLTFLEKYDWLTLNARFPLQSRRTSLLATRSVVQQNDRPHNDSVHIQPKLVSLHYKYLLQLDILYEKDSRLEDWQGSVYLPAIEPFYDWPEQLALVLLITMLVCKDVAVQQTSL